MGQRIEYARVSTDNQNLDLQFDALHKAGIGDDRLQSDTSNDKDAERKELAVRLKALREGDTLVVWRLDRLGCSPPDLSCIVEELEQKGVSFESLTEKIGTGSAAGKLVFHVFAALAEFKRNLIRGRTSAGLEATLPEAAPAAVSPSSPRPRSTSWWMPRSLPSVESLSCTVSCEPQFTR